MDFCSFLLWNDDLSMCSESYLGTPYKEIVLGCDCSTPPCFEETYDLKVSTIRLSETRAQDLAQIWGTTAEGTKDNYFDVSINFDEIDYEVRSETKAMSFTDLMASIGGSMGLFAGFSLLSLFEVIVELGVLRLIPRLWGDRRLQGVGSIALEAYASI